MARAAVCGVPGRRRGLIRWFYVSRRYGFDRGFDEFREFLPGKEHDLAASIRAETVVDAAIERLRAERETPLFLFVHLFDPHLN